MQIGSINQYNNYNLSYKGNCRSIKDNNNKLLYRTTTFFFRNGIDWQSFIENINKKYKNTPKVNIITHACSNGQESYSLASLLISKLGEKKASKFFPIVAKDIDLNNIQNALDNQILYGSRDEKELIREFIKSPFKKFFQEVENNNKRYNFAIKPKNILTKNINFSVGNIFQDIEEIPDKNTILFCRNFWPYTTEHDRSKFAKLIGKKFDETSMIIIGIYDFEKSNIADLLKKEGFSNPGHDCIFIKNNNLEKNNKKNKFINKIHNLYNNFRNYTFSN